MLLVFMVFVMLEFTVSLLTPRSLRHVSPAHFWGILYAGSYCLAFAWFFGASGPEMSTPRNLMSFALVSLAWWGLWRLLAWMLCGFPKFWQRGGSKK